MSNELVLRENEECVLKGEEAACERREDPGAGEL